jgi:hypothetical protein
MIQLPVPNLGVIKLVEIFPVVEPENSLPSSQECINKLHPEPVEASIHPHNQFL